VTRIEDLEQTIWLETAQVCVVCVMCAVLGRAVSLSLSLSSRSLARSRERTFSPSLSRARSLCRAWTFERAQRRTRRTRTKMPRVARWEVVAWAPLRALETVVAVRLPSAPLQVEAVEEGGGRGGVAAAAEAEEAAALGVLDPPI